MADSKSLDQVSEALDRFADALRGLCVGIAADAETVSRSEPDRGVDTRAAGPSRSARLAAST